MRARDRFYDFVDRPLTWTRAIIGGFVLWVVVILVLGQAPSWLIYEADAKVSTLIEWSKHLPFVGDAGLNPTQIRIARDIVANGVQFGALTLLIAGMYYWQKAKQKRLSARSAETAEREERVAAGVG